MRRLRQTLALVGGIATLGVAVPAQAQESPWGWLPPNLNPAYGHEVDHLYLVILGIVGVIFAVTEGLLLVAMLRFRARPGRRAVHSHGNNTMEIAWSIVPAGILIWLALAQRDTWADAKQRFPSESEAVVIQAFPEQFAWNFRYAGEDGTFGSDDDITTNGMLHVPVGRKILMKMTSKDVIHSFFLPHARVKQDVVPGMLTRAWFETDLLPVWDVRAQGGEEQGIPWEKGFRLLTPEEFDEHRVGVSGFRFKSETAEKNGVKLYHYKPRKKSKKAEILFHGERMKGTTDDAEYVLHYVDVACAELCGLGHYRMRAKMVIEPPAVFEQWLAETKPGPEFLKFQDLWDRDHAVYNERVGR